MSHLSSGIHVPLPPARMSARIALPRLISPDPIRRELADTTASDNLELTPERYGLPVVLGLLLVLGIGYFAATFRLFPEEVENHVADASRFHEHETARFIRLPASAQIIRDEKRTVWVDNYYESPVPAA